VNPIGATEAIVSTPTFIVGTGRCGSTMLSNMLREHPKVLSLSEFYALVTDQGWSVIADWLNAPESGGVVEPFTPKPMDGRQFWAIVAAINPMSTFGLRHGVPCAELLYPYDDQRALFSSETGIPAILLTTLPHLTDRHDDLFEVLRNEVTTWPTATISSHYRHLFGWLAKHFGKTLWIERSGGGLGMASRLMAMFPDAKFIHIVRDGRDAAISMQEHLGFRQILLMGSISEALGVDPLRSGDRTHVDRVPAELQIFLPERFDAGAFRAHRLPLPFCGENWTQQVGQGLQALKALPPDRLLTLRYEDFFVDPKQQIDQLAAFLGDEFVDEDWSDRCAATVRPPRSTWRDLPEAAARTLTEACRPGFELLRETGVHYDL
jgi:putative sulfotransferase